MSRAFKCDRCAEYFEPVSKHRNFFLEKLDDKGSSKHLDLCPLCYDKFVAWWNAGEKESKEK